MKFTAAALAASFTLELSHFKIAPASEAHIPEISFETPWDDGSLYLNAGTSLYKVPGTQRGYFIPNFFTFAPLPREPKNEWHVPEVEYLATAENQLSYTTNGSSGISNRDSAI